MFFLQFFDRFSTVANATETATQGLFDGANQTSSMSTTGVDVTLSLMSNDGENEKANESGEEGVSIIPNQLTNN